MRKYTLVLDPAHPEILNLTTDDAEIAGAWLSVALSERHTPPRELHVLIAGRDVAARVLGPLMTCAPDEIAARLRFLSQPSTARALVAA
jgi:hypothetical protein